MCVVRVAGSLTVAIRERTYFFLRMVNAYSSLVLLFLYVKCYYSNLLRHVSLNFVYICFPMKSGERSHEVMSLSLWHYNLNNYPAACDAQLFSSLVV